MKEAEEKIKKAEEVAKMEKLEEDKKRSEGFFFNSKIFQDTATNSLHNAEIHPCKRQKLLHTLTECELNPEKKSNDLKSFDSFENKESAHHGSEKRSSAKVINPDISCTTQNPLETLIDCEPRSQEFDDTVGMDYVNVSENLQDCSSKLDSIDKVNNVEPLCKNEKDVNITDHSYCKSQSNEQTENVPYFEEHITTRRIYDMFWVMDELHKAFDDNHKGSCRGLFSDLTLLRSTDHGLLSQMFWQCKKCLKTASIWSESKKSTTSLPLNESAVLGSLIAGIGYTNLKEQLATMNIHMMTDKTYRKYRDNIHSSILGTSEKEMAEAAEMEKELAIKAGQFIIHNGTKIPYITVIVDGAWSKRSYKNGRYDALSGFATIIGLQTGRVLYCGTRNKYCSACVAALKCQKEPPEHLCFKNYARDEPSTRMEADIIVDGFKCSVEFQGLIYRSFIGDGDSSVHQSIVDNNPYKEYDIEVEKIECKNHLFRNFCRHIVNASEIKIPASALPNVMTLRKNVKESAVKMRKHVEKSVEDIKKNKCDRDKQIEQLVDVLTNMPKHFFGDHSQCTDKVANGCENIKANIIASLELVGIYPIILQIVSRLSKHANSLLDNVTTNKVEGLNSIANKTLGGRRINYSQRGSFDLRVAVATIQSDTQEVGTKIHEYMGIKVPTEVTKFEQSKQAQALRTKKSRKMKGRSYRRFFGKDKWYGKVEENDIPLYEYNRKEEEHLQKLKDRQKKRDEIMKETIDQAQSANWHQYRRDIITASNFGSICNRRPTTSCAALVEKLVYPKVLNVDSIKYGRDFESQALRDLAEELNIEPKEIKPCGLFIDQHIEYLGATPDGLIGDDYIVEIKCLESIKHLSPDDALDSKIPCMVKLFDSQTGRLKKNHAYYYQVQGQLHITDRKYCYFAVWTPKGLKYEIIKRDDKLWVEKMEPLLTQFYEEAVLPEIIDSRKNRNMKIREPTFIVEAQKVAEEKKKKTNIQNLTVNEEVLENGDKKSPTFIKKLLLEVAESKTLEDIEKAWQNGSELVSMICNHVENSIETIVSDRFEHPMKCTPKYNLNTSNNLSMNNVEINHKLNNYFSLADVARDGNCLFRAVADVVLCDQEKYMHVKVFIINHVLSNKEKYEPIIHYSGIPVGSKLFPTVDDFLHKIARDTEWGDHGALYVLCKALKINVVVVGVNRSNHELINIRKYSPTVTQSVVPITIINELGFHFIAARRKIDSPKFDLPTWNDRTIEIIKVDELLTYYNRKLSSKQKRNPVHSFEITPTATNKIRNILKEIQDSESLQLIEKIVENNHDVIKSLGSVMKNFEASFGSDTNEVDEKIKLDSFPVKLLKNFNITDVQGDGNCFYRSIAKLLFNNENKYPEVKLIMINHILENKKPYTTLCTNGVLEIETNVSRGVLANPEIDDFIKMVAGDKIWGNTSSIIAISHALKLKLISFLTNDKFEVTTIMNSGPEKTRSKNFLTIINVGNSHFYAAHRKSHDYSIEDIKKDFIGIRYERYDLFDLCTNFILSN